MQPRHQKKSSLLILIFTFLLLSAASSACNQMPQITSEATQPPAPLSARNITLPAPEVNATLQPPENSSKPQALNQLPTEVPVVYIPLKGPAALTQAEYSGMAWYQDLLVLLPQYPQRMSDQAGGMLYAIPRQELKDFIQGVSTEPIQPREILLVSDGLDKAIAQFEGYEAIAFKDQRVYLSIEAREGLNMMGYLVSGQVNENADEIKLDPSTLTQNPPQQQQSNRSDEAILIVGEQVLTFFESNGAQANPLSYGTLFDLSLKRLGVIEFPAVEYRLTDATELDDSGRFWMMNYFFPGEPDLLPSVDPIRESFGAGATHRQSATVERLLEFQYTPQGISLSGTPPIQLQLLAGDESRNWEGLVRLDDLGFLLITDKFPSTLLGFVAYP